MPTRRRVRHRASGEHRGRPVLWGIAVIAVVAVALAAGIFFIKGAGTGKAQPNAAARDAARTANGCPSAAVAPTPGCSRLTAPTASAAPTMTVPRPHPGRAVRHEQPSAAPTRSASPRPATPPTTPVGGQPGGAAAAVLALVNQARAQAGLSAYTVTRGLDRSAAAHNTLMARGCGLSHQCPGEPSLGTRETQAGVIWTAAGENIGDGGPVPGSTSAVTQLAVALTRDMLNEKPPDSGHRQNILSSSFRHLGIAVYRNGAGIVWMTQDFSN